MELKKGCQVADVGKTDQNGFNIGPVEEARTFVTRKTAVFGIVLHQLPHMYVTDWEN